VARKGSRDRRSYQASKWRIPAGCRRSSVYRHSILSNLTPPLGARDVAPRPDDVVIGFTVADVRAVKLGVKNDPWPEDVVDPDHPRNAAHALTVGWHGLGRKARIRRQQELTRLPSMAFV
jgi:hypothetical protein